MSYMKKYIYITKYMNGLTFYCSGLNQGHTECFLVVLNKSTETKIYTLLRALKKEDTFTVSDIV
jgi:hypothetical protein